MQRRDFAAAEELLAQAVEKYPLDPEAHRQYALVLWQRGARREAMAQMDRAVELAGDEPTLLVQRAEWHLASNSLPAAEADAEAALDADARLASAWLLRARLAMHRGESLAALAAYHRVLAMEPNHRPALLEAAHVHWSLSADPAGGPHLQRALMTTQTLLETYAPGEEPAAALFLAGRIHARLGRHDDAARLLAAAQSRGGENVDVLLALAESQLLAGHPDVAHISAQRALVIAPQNAAGHDLLQRIEAAHSGRGPVAPGFAGDPQALRR